MNRALGMHLDDPWADWRGRWGEAPDAATAEEEEEEAEAEEVGAVKAKDGMTLFLDSCTLKGNCGESDSGSLSTREMEMEMMVGDEEDVTVPGSDDTLVEAEQTGLKAE